VWLLFEIGAYRIKIMREDRGFKEKMGIKKRE
jgi:hypothetical protein